MTTAKSPNLGCQIKDLFRAEGEPNNDGCAMQKKHPIPNPLSEYATPTEMDEALLECNL